MGVALVIVCTGPRVGALRRDRARWTCRGGSVVFRVTGHQSAGNFRGGCHLPLFHPVSGALCCFHVPSRVVGGVPGFFFFIFIFIFIFIFYFYYFLGGFSCVLCVCGL